MNNKILQDLKNRYTSKKYDPTKRISQDNLDTLYEAMRLSVSSINSQPWKFIVIRSEEAKQRMYKTFENNFQFNQPHILASDQVILFAHNPHYTREDYAKVVDKGIEDQRTTVENRDNAFAGFVFAQMNTDNHGYNGHWTKAQLYLALGNTIHTLARLKIDSTPLEGIDVDLVAEEFKEELDGYHCHVALAIGYHHEEDFNATLPKTRLSYKDVFVTL